MELKIFNISGAETGRTITLDDAIFNVEPNDHAIYLDVKQYLANQRQGTHKSKDRSEVSGSTRKLKKQKGTGGARWGDINSPVFVGGGRAFGPRPRDYRFKLNKKLKRLARRSAMSYKLQDNAITIVEDFTMEVPKTKRMIEILNNLKISDKKPLFVLLSANNYVSLSARNLQNVKTINASNVNTYDILNASNLVISESSIKELEAVLTAK